MVPPPVLDPAAPLARPFTDAVSAALQGFLAGQADVLAELGPELAVLHRAAADLLAGGKRLRPAFCAWGYVAAAGLPGAGTLPGLLGAAASLEVLHASALVHDDVMDGSDLRRGRPAAHRALQTLHSEGGWVGDAAAFGRAGAILLGDLLVMWSVEMLETAGVPEAALARARPIVAAMRTEVTGGQYLDIHAQAQPLSGRAAAGPGPALDEASRVTEYKSARYTVRRPCQAGAALGGGDERLHRALGAYGSPLGRAFQFRDDLLGVFGDPRLTGKPAGDDLREGKRTVLIAHAYAHASRTGRELLANRLGDPDLDADGVAALREVIEASGARAAVEAMIAEGHDGALAALAEAELSPEGRTALTVLADAAVNRRA